MRDATVVEALYEILERARTLSEDDNPLVRVSAERIGVIVVDALVDLDPENFDDPWESVPTNGSRT